MAKKFLFILVCVFCFIMKNYAQFPGGMHPLSTDKFRILDKASLKVSYELTFLEDSTVKTKKTVNPPYVLLIGTKMSKFYCNQPKYVKKNLKIDEGLPRDKSEGLAGTEVYKTFSDNSMLVTVRPSATKKVFRYKEKIAEMKWEISDETCQILSYKCSKATTYFRGRYYIAWFTTDIPIQNGPWKFGGLPGLILEIYDSNDNFHFKCIGLENQKEESIKEYEWEYSETTREKTNSLIKRAHDNLLVVLESLGMKYVGTDPIPPIPYNPIELE